MNCQEAKQAIFAYLDAQLDPGQEQALYQHLLLCYNCQRELNLARETNRLLEKSCTPVSPPANFSQEVMQRIFGESKVSEEKTCPAISHKQNKAGSWWRRIIRSVFDLEAKALLVTSYAVLFIAIGIIFLYGYNQLNELSTLGSSSSNQEQLPVETKDQDKAKPEVSQTDEQKKETQVRDKDTSRSPSLNTGESRFHPGPVQGSSASPEQVTEITPPEDLPPVKVVVEPVNYTVMLTPVALGEGVANIRPRWSPDGKEIWFLSNRDSADGKYTVWKTPVDRSNPEPLTDAQVDIPVMYGGGVWSPDGSQIAYVTYQNGYPEVWVYDLLSGNSSNLTLDVTGEARQRLEEKTDDLWAYNPVWSPKGEIAYLTTRFDNVDIMLIDKQGENHVLTQTEAVEGYPAWSPDGEKLAYFRSWFNPETGQQENQVYLINKDGTEPVSLTPPIAAASMVPAWSPDGKRIAINVAKSDSTAEVEKSSGIWLVNADGTNLQKITDVGGGTLIEWSPDGKKLAFNDEDGVLYVLYLSTDYREIKLFQVTWEGDPSGDMAVAWSPASDKLLLDWTKPEEATRGIWLARLPKSK
ncbi:zf-HC2 domain-containing protein [Calderihabitans maritimus]|uniref:Anti-sigma-W factor RsiW n=1 Tax=Calderihabitans maritimus TaxID=1246530 RepID=A0A1Z5HWR0_9FIRM|nr:zf-HC2 domain-containing protein [Calderihabitans maritimus]GAW93771.1 hypothetical protein KKC1_28980 [Calderihabitans maritimus]